MSRYFDIRRAHDIAMLRSGHRFITSDGTNVTAHGGRPSVKFKSRVGVTSWFQACDVTMFGRKSVQEAGLAFDSADLAKLLFDTFSKRLTGVEASLKAFYDELERLKLACDRSQISDIVLLERLQKIEATLGESLSWIKKVADDTGSQSQSQLQVASSVDSTRKVKEIPYSSPGQRLIAPDGGAESLPSITTPTELHVLSLLAERGPMSAPEVGKVVGRSREHSARLMKKLFDEGYVRRDQARIPFRYSLVDRVRKSFKEAETKPEEKETVAVPQT